MSTFVDVLRVRPFRLLLIGGTVSRVGDVVAPVALAFAVLDLTGSLTDLGIVVGARSAANLVFLLIGGVLADRLPRGVLLVGASVLAGATQAAVAATVLTHLDSVALLAGLSAINGAISAIPDPITSALIPQTLPEALLRPGNAIIRLSLNTSGVLGTAVGGILVAVVGPGFALALDAGSFLVAGVIFAGIRISPDTQQKVESVWRSFAAGWSTFASTRWLWTTVLAFMVVNACWVGAIDVLGPAIADQTFGRAFWGFALAAFAAGAIIGALANLRLRLRRPLLVGVLCNSLWALVPLSLAIAPTPWIIIPAFLVAGIGMEFFLIAWNTTLQTHIPNHLLARVASYDLLGSFLAIPVGQIAAAPIVSAFGMSVTLITAAALITAACFSLLLVEDVRNFH